MKTSKNKLLALGMLFIAGVQIIFASDATFLMVFLLPVIWLMTADNEVI